MELTNGLPRFGFGEKLKAGLSPWFETGDKVSVTDCGGGKLKPPKAGDMPVGDMCELSGILLNVPRFSGRIMLPSGNAGVYVLGEASGVPRP